MYAEMIPRADDIICWGIRAIMVRNAAHQQVFVESPKKTWWRIVLTATSLSDHKGHIYEYKRLDIRQKGPEPLPFQ
jgi:hypothetical protein